MNGELFGVLYLLEYKSLIENNCLLFPHYAQSFSIIVLFSLALSKYHAITGQSIQKLAIVYSCLAGTPSPSENEGCVANTQPGPYSYHCINITVVCSVHGTEVVTSVCCYLMPTVILSIKKKFLEPEMCSIDCASNSLSS